MIPWDFFLHETALATVLPEEHARFRRPVAGALRLFLEGLSGEHQAAILEAQAALPATARPAERLARLARSCPALHKLGQVLARDRRLAPELRRHLQELESLPPAVPLRAIQKTLARELGPLDRRGVTLLPPALAEASVAVVIPFREERSAADGGPRAGVFKVLKPGIEERLEQELALFERVGSYLDEQCAEFPLPPLDYQDAFNQVRDKLRYEVRLDLEQQHLARAHAAYEAEPRVLVPALLEHCTARVTAMERVQGCKVTDHGLQWSHDRARLAGLVVRALLGHPIFSRASEALFHADPHAGNLFLTPDGRLAILDWSLVGNLGERERVAIVQVLVGALTLDSRQIVSTLVDLAERRAVDLSALDAIAQDRVGRVRRGQLPGFNWLVGLLDEAVLTARLRFGTDLLLFRKTLHTLEGVLADVGAGPRGIDEALLGEFLQHLTVEWPRRWLTLPHDRGFATRLSNADLARVVLGFPWAAAQFWLNQVQAVATLR